MPDGLYPPMPRSPVTYLSQAIDEIVTTVEVDNTAKLPVAPNIATIGAGEDSETIKYTGKVGNNLTGVTRGFEGEARSWNKGAPIANVPCAQHFKSLQSAIATLKAELMPITGSNEYGEWTKFPDGTMICWADLGRIAFDFTAYGDLWRSEYYEYPYPQEFIDVPSPGGGPGRPYLYAIDVEVGTVAAGWRIRAMSNKDRSGQNAGRIRVSAIGRWK